MFFNFKSITKGKKKIAGKTNSGVTSCWHRGGAHKINFKYIDFFRKPTNMLFKVCGFEYDASRTSYVILLGTRVRSVIHYTRVLYTKNVGLSNEIRNNPPSVTFFGFGDAYFIADLPVGASIHSIEKTPGQGSKLVRAAGCFGQIVQKTHTSVVVKLPSGKLLYCKKNTRCTFGIVGYDNNKLCVIGKAGRARWLGRRPIVRGVAMNPVDHPHGGGEGKSKVGGHPVTPWGKLTKGKKTK